MKFQIYILSSFLYSYFTSIEKVYKCGNSLNINTCYLSQPSSDGDTITYYLSACSKGKYCQESNIKYTYNLCTKRNSLLSTGKKCSVGNECQSGICEGEKCSLRAEGSLCETDSNCEPNLFCDDSRATPKCSPYIDEDKKCKIIDEYNAKPCKAGYICANGKCIQQFSLNNGNITDNKFACKSNFMYKGKCAEVVSVSQCIKGQVCSVKLTVSKESDTELKAKDCDDNEDTNDCAYYQWYYDRLSAWKEYYEEFNKTIDEIKTDEELTSSRMRSESYFIYTYNKKKLNELDVMYYRKTRIADNEEGDCIKEYYMRQQSEYMIRISILNVILFILLIFI